MKAWRMWAGVAAGWLALGLTGCRVAGFYGQAVAGQVEVMIKREPVEEVIRREPEGSELRKKLEATQRILDFAESKLKLESKGSYRHYTDLGRKHLVWVMHAVPELSMEPYRWWYPVVGWQDYRGYFREEGTAEEAARLEAKGYETWSDGVDAYSTLGFFNDPLLNTFMDRDEVEIAELLFHELTHQKYYLRGETKFSEGLAEAVAREGVKQWLEETGRPDLRRRYEERNRRIQRAGRAIQATTERLKGIYGGKGTEEEKRQAKAREIARLKRELEKLRGEWGGGLQSWIEEPINGARLNAFTAYEDEIPRFEKIFKECGGDWEEFWERVKEEGRNYRRRER